MSVNNAHPPNAISSILVTVDGIVTSIKYCEAAKAPKHTLFTLNYERKVMPNE